MRAVRQFPYGRDGEYQILTPPIACVVLPFPFLTPVALVVSLQAALGRRRLGP